MATRRLRAQTVRRLQDLASYSATFRERNTSAILPSGRRLFRGVTLIKAGLGNQADKHFYPAHVLKEAVEKGMFERLRAYADHPSRVDETIQPERTIRDMVGLYTNVRFVREGERGGRVVGDLNVLKSQRWLADNIDDLKQLGAADRIGISINGQGDTRAAVIKEAGGEVNEVLNFRRLSSADVVTEAGAGGGFSQLLESARRAVARKEQTTMGKKSLLAKIAEAARKGDEAEVKKLTEQLATATDPSAGKGGKKAAKAEDVREAKGKKAKAADEDVPEDDEEEADLEEADDDADAEEDVDDADADEAEDDEDDDADETEDAGDEEADTDVRERATAERASGSLTERFRAGTRVHADGSRTARTEVRENAMYVAGGKKNMNAKGGVTKGKGSMTTKAGQGRKQTGKRYAEADGGDCGCGGKKVREVETDRTAELEEQLREALDANRELRAQISRQTREVAAKKIAGKFKNLDKAGQQSLASKLVRECRNVSEMQREAQFYSTLLEGAVNGTVDRFQDDDEPLEGMPARIRESFGAGGDESVDDFVTDVGLPLKREAQQ